MRNGFPRAALFRRAHRAAAAAGVAAALTGSSGAVWDLGGTAGLQQSWTENADYASRGRAGDAVTSLRLSGIARRMGARTRTMLSYSPNATYLRDRSDLNRVSHQANAISDWELTRRNSISLAANYSYTPEQGNPVGSGRSPVVFTRFSDRRGVAAELGWRLRATDRTQVAVDARRHVMSFGNERLVDSIGFDLSSRVLHELGPRSGLEFTGVHTWQRFAGPVFAPALDPNGNPVPPGARRVTGTHRSGSRVTGAHAGGRYALTSRLTTSGRVGYSLVLPEDPAANRRRSVLAGADLQWGGARINARGGYDRNISAGSGPFDLSRSASWHADLSVSVTPSISTSAQLTRTRSESVGAASTGRTESLSGIAHATFRLRRNIEATAGISRHVQDSSNSARRSGGPELAFNRYFAGLVARFD